MNSAWWVDLSQLDDVQRTIIDLSTDGSFHISGPPGSGKTNLLVLRANFLVKNDLPNLLIVVFTRTLREFIVSGGKEYDFNASRVLTSTRWMQDLLIQLGESPARHEGKFPERRAKLLAQLQDTVARRNLKHAYDVILLDEAQDYTPEEIELFARLGRYLFITSDSHQKIYSGPDPTQAIDALNCKRYQLRHHYRNGHQICKFADVMAEHFQDHISLMIDTNYKETERPSTVSSRQAPSFATQVDNAIEMLTLQIRTFGGELMGVLCPTRKDVEAAWERIQASALAGVAVKQSADDGYAEFGPDHRVCVSTIHSAKGLEYRAVHVLGTDTLAGFSNERNLIYTAATRAKTSLTLHHGGALPGYVEKGLAAIAPIAKRASAADAFGKRSS